MEQQTDKKSISIDEERKLVAAAQADPDEFRHLFNHYHDMIFNYILRRTANAVVTQDITANTFLKALDNLQKFRWKGVSFAAWLYRIATNEINLNYRGQHRIVRLSDEVASKTVAEKTADHALLQAEEEVIRNEKFRRMHHALSQLDMKYQSVLSLKYFENKSTKEIAEILDMAENTVKTHTRRGLMKLRNVI